MGFTDKTNVVLQDRHLEFLTFPIPVIFYKKNQYTLYTKTKNKLIYLNEDGNQYDCIIQHFISYKT